MMLSIGGFCKVLRVWGRVVLGLEVGGRGECEGAQRSGASDVMVGKCVVAGKLMGGECDGRAQGLGAGG